MAGRRQVESECSRKNRERRVKESGATGCANFLSRINGNLLVSGNIDHTIFLKKLLGEYESRRDGLTILLTQNVQLLQELSLFRKEGGLEGLIVASPDLLSYYPMYGMSRRQILPLIQETAKEYAYTNIERVAAYADAFLSILEASGRLALPEILSFGGKSDDELMDLGRSRGVSEYILENLGGNRAAGSTFRLILGHLQMIFGNIMIPGSRTEMNIQAVAVQDYPLLAVYSCSTNQRILNLYLKEELETAFRRCQIKGIRKMFRIVLDDIAFVSKEDELLRFLMNWKRQYGVEIAVISRNAAEMLCEKENLKGFSNVIVASHDVDESTEEVLSLLGSYMHYEPILGGGHGERILPRLASSEHWTMHAANRLRVRAEDLRW